MNLVTTDHVLIQNYTSHKESANSSIKQV